MNLQQHPQTEHLVNMFLVRPSHSVGLFGPPGSGKDYLAWHMAAKLLGVSIEKAKEHPRLFMIDVEAEDGIERVRELQSFLSLKVPGTNPIRRCVIIRELEKLNHTAQNALLKTLEEPPTDTVIICTLSYGQSVLPTIASRLQTIQVLPIAYEQAQAGLVAFSKPDIERAYHISEGYVGLLMALLEKNQDHPLAIEITEAKTILQATSYERLAKVDTIVKDKQRNVLNLLDALYKLLHAATIALSKRPKPNQADLLRLNRQTARVLRAQRLIEERAQPKIVLAWLFYSL